MLLKINIGGKKLLEGYIEGLDGVRLGLEEFQGKPGHLSCVLKAYKDSKDPETASNDAFQTLLVDFLHNFYK